MSEPTPERPLDDDLDQAYARAQSLAGDGRGPSASVRASVLAAAARIAAGEAGAAPPLVPVAPPVAPVGSRRGAAVNLSSWRLRSGAALCALLLVCAGIWRFDQNGRLGGNVQVALAELRLAEPRTAPAPQDLPLPAATAASYPYAPPPAVVVDPVDGGASVRGAAAKRAEPDRGLVVAQLDARAEAPRAAPQADAAAPPAAAQPGPARPAAAAVAAAPPAPAPVVLAANAPRAESRPTEQESATVTITAAAPAAPPTIMTSPPRLPSVLPRRMMLVPRPGSAPAARPAPAGDTAVAMAETAARSRDAARVQSPAAAPPAPLQAAADRGDVDALKALLSDPATNVDSPDVDGRTALLHAVLAQRPAAVRLLLAAGADPGRADRTGLTPRQAAQTGPDAEIAALLGTGR